MVHPHGVQPVPAMQAPSGPVVPTPEQLGKIRSELDIVHGNITVMSEMLTEMTPGQEEAGDLQLLQVKLQSPFSLLARQNETRGERPRPASDELFDEAADQISGRNLPVFKTGFV